MPVPLNDKAYQKRNKSVSLRAFLTRLIWLCILPLLILTVYLVADHLATLKNYSDSSAKDLAHNITNAVDRNLASSITSLQALSNSPLLDDPARMEEVYGEALAFWKSYRNHIVLADLSSQMIFNTRLPFGSKLPNLPVPKGFAAAPYVLKTGKPAVGDMFLGPVAKEPMIAVVVPVIREAKIRFLILNAIETRHFREIIDEMAVPQDWSVTLHDGKGDVIASRESSILLDGGAPEVAAKSFEVPSRLSHWRLVLNVPYSSYTSPLISSAVAMGLAVIGAILVGVMGGSLAGRGLSRSVEALSMAEIVNEPHPLITEIEDVREKLVAAVEARESAMASRLEVEDRFRKLFEASPVPMSLVSTEGVVIEINERFIRAFGYSREDLPTLASWRSVAYPDPEYHKWVVSSWKDAINQALTENVDIPSMEYHITCKDGAKRIVLVSGVIIGDEILTTFFDITERKQVEKALLDSELRFRILADGAFEGVVISRDGKFLDFNDVFGRMIGYSQAELAGSEVINLVAPEFRETVMSQIRSNSEEAYEATIVSRDGANIPVQIRAKIIPYEGGLARLASVRDIQAAKKAEDVQRRLATAITQAAEAILITDSEGTIQYVNPSLERISGFSAEELIGKNPRVFKSGEHDYLFYRELWDTIKSGAIWSGRLTNRRKDGKLYFEEATISPVKDNTGKIVSFVAVKRDVTEYLSLTRQLFQAQKLEAIGTLAGGIAHDFNNILQICLGYSQLLADDKSLPAGLRDDALNIYEASRRGADLVHRLLTFSKKKESKPEALDLNKRINEMKKMLTRTISKTISIELILSDDLAKIHADPTQIDQVIMNVVVNARDAMPEGGKLTVETANIFLSPEYAKTHLYVNPGPYVLLMLTDTGTGMDEQTMSRIFEPFYTTKEHGQGTGLGLSVVFGIVEQHGGFIRYYSEPGLGTTCKIYFPAMECESELPRADLKITPSGGTETVMVVDDEDQIIEYLSRALEKSGYSIIVARNGYEALEVFEKRREEISAIILDLVMPQMDGSQCLKELLKLDPGVKVIISSGFSANGKIRDVVKEGAKGFVVKPFDVAQILSLLRDIIDGKH